MQEQIESIKATFKAHQDQVTSMMKAMEDQMNKYTAIMEEEIKRASGLEPAPPAAIHLEGENAKVFSDAINAIAAGLDKISKIIN